MLPEGDALLQETVLSSDCLCSRSMSVARVVYLVVPTSMQRAWPASTRCSGLAPLRSGTIFHGWHNRRHRRLAIVPKHIVDHANKVYTV